MKFTSEGCVPHAEAEVGPARVGHQGGVAALGIERPACRVETRDPGVTSACDVQRREVQREAEQPVPQRVGHELVEFVADLARHAANDVSGRVLRGPVGCIDEGLRVEERVEEGDALVDAGRRRAVDGLGEHRVPEPVHGVGELGADRRVDLGVIARAALAEQVDHRLHLAGELLERQVLVLHLGHEPGGLEEALVVVPVRPVRRDRRPVGALGISEVRRLQHLVDHADEAVVLGVEDVVHGREADVLVDPTVTGDEVRVEHLVVVRRAVAVIRDARIGVRLAIHGARERALERSRATLLG